MKSTGDAGLLRGRSSGNGRVLPTLPLIFALGAIYFIAGKTGLAMAVLHPSVSPIWAPTGIAITAFLLLGHRVWPGVLIGAFILNLTTPGSVATSLGIAVGNTLEGLLAAYLVNRFAKGRLAFVKATDILKFFVLAGLLSTAVSAMFGVTSLTVGGGAEWDHFQTIWFTWWIGDMVGAIVITPLLLMWIDRPIPRMTMRRALEALCLLCTIILFGVVLFLDGSSLASTRQLSYLFFIPLGWAAFRFEHRGAITSAFLMSCIALWGTLNGMGPFIHPDPNVSLLLLQAFVGAAATLGLILASLVADQRKSEERLKVKEAVSMVLANSTTLKDAAPGILRPLCEMARWDFGVVWSVDRTQDEIFCVEQWHVPLRNVAEFEEATRRLRFPRGIGLPGRTWSSGVTEWIMDISSEHDLPRHNMALKAGMRSAVCFPIKLGDEVLGVIECFCSEIREPDSHFLTMLPIIGSQIGQFIERRNAEQSLRSSEEHKAAILQSAVDGIITIDRFGCVLELNQAAGTMLRRRPDDVVGNNLFSLIMPVGWQAPSRSGFEHSILTETGFVPGKRVEMTFMRPDGSSFPADFCIIRSTTEGPLRFTAFISDISDRKRAENELREARDELETQVRQRTADLVRANEELRKRDLQLSTAQQIARLGSWEWDLRTSKVSWSDELHDIYGLRPDEFSGTIAAFLALVHPEDRPHASEQMQEAVRKRSSFDFQQRIIRPDGSIRVLLNQGRVSVNEQGEVVKFTGVCLDVTERNRAEQKFRGLLEAAPDAMVIVNQDGRIVLVNRQTEHLFGYSRAELLGQPVEILLPGGFRKGHAENRAHYISSPHSRPMGAGLALYGLRKDNTEFPVEISLSPLETEEGMLVSSAIRDITEQELLRARLVETERRRLSDLRRYVRSVQRAQEEERQRVARELHDDLCQRLSGMKLNLEVIADGIRAKNRGLYRRLLQLNRQCEDMIGEVRRMAANLRPAILDDFGLITAVERLTRTFEKLHRIRVDLVIDEPTRLDLGEHLETALYRITQEALSNIAKHSRASRVTLSLRKTTDAVLLSISDNGKGLLPGDGNSRRDCHHGIGLISMRERSELLGGVFCIASAPEVGTTISVTIPLIEGKRLEEDVLSPG